MARETSMTPSCYCILSATVREAQMYTCISIDIIHMYNIHGISYIYLKICQDRKHIIVFPQPACTCITCCMGIPIIVAIITVPTTLTITIDHVRK